MSINNFSVGKDFVLDIITPTGPLRLPLTVKFAPKQDKSEQRRKHLDGVTRTARFWGGWSGSIEVDRSGPAIDDYFARLEAGFYNGESEDPCTITETVTEKDGSVSQYRYRGVLLSYDDAGERSGESVVTQKLSFTAERREKIA